MAGQQALRKNGDESQEVRDELDQIVRTLESSEANPLLEESNPGLGNYDEHLLHQQRDAYWKGLIADRAVSSLLIDRAIDKTKESLAKKGIAFYDEDGGDAKVFKPLDESDIGDKESRWNAERERGEDIWRQLGRADKAITEKQMVAMVKVTGLEPGQWLPLVWHYFIGSHEMSRSLNAELIRLYLGQTYTVRDNAEGEGTTQSLLRGK